MYNSPYYDYSYDAIRSAPSLGTSSAASVGAGLGIFAGFFLFILVLAVIAWIVLVAVAQWKIFKKAGKDGWKALIPLYNQYTMLQILNMEPLLFILFLIPGCSFVLKIVMDLKLAKSFGKGVGFAIGLIFLEPIFDMILGFGSAKYSKLPSSK